MSLKELEQDPFDVVEFIERLAWRTSGGVARTESDSFDPMKLHAAFKRTISDAKDMGQRMEKKIEKLENLCKEEEKQHWQRVAELQKHNQTAFNYFEGLDSRINFVATKVVHVGDQLEGINGPRARAAEAQMLMNYFSEFMEDKPKSDIFTDPFKLQIAADIIQKLYIIVHELPVGEKFDEARRNITNKYNEIEKDLLNEFRQCFVDMNNIDKRKMRRLATILSHFKGYNQCVDMFVKESLSGLHVRDALFEVVPGLVGKSDTLIKEIFLNPEVVLSKLILFIYQEKIQKLLENKLSDRYDLERYLREVFQLYTKTNLLNSQLACYKLGADSSMIPKITKTIFSKYLHDYISLELKFLNQKSAQILHRYYESRHHQKKHIQTGGIYEFRRDLQAAIGTKANLNLGPAIHNYGGEIFLSQEVSINLLQEAKMAYKRTETLSNRSEAPGNATKIFEVLVQYLCLEHIDYALDLGLQGIPLSDCKTEPEIYFFDVVGQTNPIFHLFEKQFSDHLVPLIRNTPKHSECLSRKQEIMEQIENKLDLGLDRTLSAMIGWIKHILVTDQKKTDYKPDTDSGTMEMYSKACGNAVKYINMRLESIRQGLDGKNLENMLAEFGVRIHRVVYEHLLTFQYNTMGAALATCDVNEYGKCVKEFKNDTVIRLFDTLHSLCNLLLVVPEHIQGACQEEPLKLMDKSVLMTIVQLRADYKSSRLANYFK